MIHKPTNISVVLLILVVGINTSYASETIQGHYCYTYGDSESVKDARAVAKSLAIRNAIESYRVYVSSSTNVKNFVLTEDMVRVLSSGYLRNIKIINSSEKDRKICYGVRATVDPKEFDAALKKEIEKATKDEKNIEADKQRLEKEIGRDGRFIAYDNGTVLDTKTNLMWAAKYNGADINWQGAQNYCENYRRGGYMDWRMPTQDELAGLYIAAETYKSDCGYEVHLTELIRLTCTSPWVSETVGSNASVFSFYTEGRSLYPQWYHFGTRALPVRFAK